MAACATDGAPTAASASAPKPPEAPQSGNRAQRCHNGGSVEHGMIRQMAAPLLVLLGLIAAGALISWLIRRLRLSMITSFSISEQQAADLRAELLDYVKENSFGEGYVVDLAPFWRQRGLKEADKVLVMGPLLNSGHLLVMTKAPAESLYGIVEQVLDKWAENVLLPLPPKVLLNPQIYQRMLFEGSRATQSSSSFASTHRTTSSTSMLRRARR
jgi:hypothetical protein